MNWRLILVLILLLLLIVFATQNYELAEIKFLFWSFRTSRAIIIFSSVFIGIVIGWVISLARKR